MKQKVEQRGDRQICHLANHREKCLYRLLIETEIFICEFLENNHLVMIHVHSDVTRAFLRAKMTSV